MMDIRSHFVDVPTEVTVEAIYLAGRLLSRPLSWHSFVRQLEADVVTDLREQAVRVVRSVVDEIEATHRQPVERLSESYKLAYVHALDSFMQSIFSRATGNLSEIEETLEALRRIP